MGYTNYWSHPKELNAGAFAAAVRDARIVLRNMSAEVAGPSGDGAPVLNGNEIIFNGGRGMFCESFSVFRKIPGDEVSRWRYGYCKTRKYAYDVAVKATLLILRHHLGNKFKYGTDGEDALQWWKAERLCRAVLGYPRGCTRRLFGRLLSCLTGR